MPPTLTSVGHQGRHPTATFSAPRADSVAIYIASKPDRATDGSFLSENIVELDFFTDSEIQAGRWLHEHRIAPGSYWVMLRASPDFDACYIGAGTYDPGCADGFSNLVTLVVPKPPIRYTASATAFRYSGTASLELIARPLGERLRYRVCYRLRTQRMRCVSGTLTGYSWESNASDTLTVSTRNLPTVATFRWIVAGRTVATKRVRVR